MRILYVHSGNMYGGVEALLLTLARHRHLCPEMEPQFALSFEGRLSQELTAVGATVHRLGEVRVRHPLSVLRARQRLGELLRRESFDLAVCHSTWSQSLFGPVIRSHRLPLIFWLHSPTDGRHWLDRWGRRVVPDLALCNSHFTAATLPNLYPRVRAEVVYCPVAPAPRSFSYVDRLATRAELSTPDEATVIIQVSRLEGWKGQSLLFEALSLLNDLPDWICWQVGGTQRPEEVTYLEHLKNTAARQISERVRFLGQRSDVPRLLAAADIYSQPNTGPEPFGIAFIEALYASLPVVTTALGGACEIVNDSCGLLVPPGNAQALAASLRKLIQNRALRMKMRQRGPARARDLCDVETQMEKMYSCFSRVCPPRSQGSKGYQRFQAGFGFRDFLCDLVDRSLRAKTRSVKSPETARKELL